MNFNSTPKTNTSSLVISPISGTPTTLVSPRHLGHPCRLAPGLTGIGTGRAELLLDSHQLIVLGLGRQRRRQRRRQRLRGRLVWTLGGPAWDFGGRSRHRCLYSLFCHILYISFFGVYFAEIYIRHIRIFFFLLLTCVVLGFIDMFLVLVDISVFLG